MGGLGASLVARAVGFHGEAEAAVGDDGKAFAAAAQLHFVVGLVGLVLAGLEQWRRRGDGRRGRRWGRLKLD